MKYPHTSLIPLFIGVLATAGFSQTAATRSYQKPTVISPPAVPDGSARSRAPLPAQRQLDDLKAPDGQAIDQTLPPNTPATNTEAPVPPPRIAIWQGTSAPAFAAEPALMPTGRTTTTVAYGYGATTRSAQKPVVMTPPAVPDGSARSRAPLPAQRPLDDLKAPDGEAIDHTLPPNTAATNTEAAVPAPSVAVFQPAPATVIAVEEPALVPTGRSTVMVATNLDVTAVAQSIRSGTAASRDQILGDIEARMAAADKTMKSVHSAARDDAKAKEKMLKKSISNARKDWDASRDQLAADYEAYAAAVAQVDSSH